MLVRTSTRAGAEGENTDRHTNVLKERDLETLMPPELTERAYNLMAAQFVYYRFVTLYQRMYAVVVQRLSLEYTISFHLGASGLLSVTMSDEPCDHLLDT